jgi:hypothetical protein
MSTQPALASLSPARKILLASGVLLLIVSFLPWYHASGEVFGRSISVSASGWHQIGTVAWIVLIATLIWEGSRVAGAAPVDEKRGNLVTAGLAGLTLVLGVIFVIVRLTDGDLGIGFWLGVILMIVFAYATFQLFQAAGGQDAVREAQAEMQQRRAQQQAQQPQSSPVASQQPPAGAQPPASAPPTQQPPAGAPQDPPANA